MLGSTAPVYHIVGIDDFTGDGQADILFRHDNGDIALWQVANNQLAVGRRWSARPRRPITSSRTGDFDGNGAKDILFRGDNGELVEWLLDSTGGLLIVADRRSARSAVNYHVDGTGDLNGDGRDDIIFRDADGTLVEWLMNGTSFAAPPAVIGHARGRLRHRGASFRRGLGSCADAERRQRQIEKGPGEARPLVQAREALTPSWCASRRSGSAGPTASRAQPTPLRATCASIR